MPVYRVLHRVEYGWRIMFYGSESLKIFSVFVIWKSSTPSQVGALRLAVTLGGGGGVLPYISLEGMCRFSKGRVFAPFWSENGYRLSSFWSGIWYGFQGSYGTVRTIYCFNSKWVRKKKKYANSKWILRNLFCCCSNPNNDDISFLKARSESGYGFF